MTTHGWITHGGVQLHAEGRDEHRCGTRRLSEHGPQRRSGQTELDAGRQAFVRRERILGAFLRGEMTRDEAVETVGIDWVELAERQHRAAKEDLSWPLGD